MLVGSSDVERLDPTLFFLCRTQLSNLFVGSDCRDFVEEQDQEGVVDSYSFPSLN